MDYELLIKNIEEDITSYIKKDRIQALVTGVSGGIDSAVTCALVQPVSQRLGIPLIGLSIPIESNKPSEIERAKLVGKNYCSGFHEMDFTGEYRILRDRIWQEIGLSLPDHDINIANGNIKARMRMILNYFASGIRGGMVLSNDNLSEYYLGFYTKHGDVGDFGPIQNMWKSEIYAFVPFLADRMDSQGRNAHPLIVCRKGMPTDGLGISDSDLDQILPGWQDQFDNYIDAYGEVDRIIKTWLCKDMDSFFYDEVWMYEGRPKEYDDFVAYRDTFKDHLIVKLHERTHHKRNGSYNISRNVLIRGMELL
jgi:NAD+ synthetase